MIDVNPNQLKTVTRILAGHLPEYEVRAFGSRVTWTAKDYSDLDLVVVGERALDLDALSRLKEAFEESDLPFRVDVLDWHAIGPAFRKVIEKKYEVVQKSKKKSSGMAGNTWSDVQLSDIIDVKHGFAFRGENIREDPPGDILLTPGNFAVGGGFKGDKYKYFDGQVPEEYILHENDLIVTMTDLSKQADTLGYPALVPKPRHFRFLHNQRLGKVLIRDDAKVDKRFISYMLRTPDYRHEVLASATGTTVKHTSPSRILAFKTSIPPLPEQRAIAHILGTLDDKIELNRRMNETLEAMARALFKSWFVDFDPVHAKATGRDSGLPEPIADLFSDSFVDSELGEIPKGWEVKPLPDVIEVNPPRPLRKGDVAPYLDMANMPTRRHSPDAVIDRPFGSGMRFVNGDTLVARITPCLENGKTAYVDFLPHGQIGWGSTEYIVLRPKPPLPDEFAYCLARATDFRDFAIQSMTGSSGRQRVPTESLSHFRVVAAPKPIAELFGRFIKPLFARASAVTKEGRTFAALRDTLLPKLISGELRIDAAERFIKEPTI